MTRKLWIQREVVEMAQFLGFKKFYNNSLNHWTEAGVFPKPVTGIKNSMLWYKTNDVIVGLIAMSKRSRPVKEINQEDVEMAMKHVLETTKAKNVTQMLRKIKAI